MRIGCLVRLSKERMLNFQIIIFTTYTKQGFKKNEIYIYRRDVLLVKQPLYDLLSSTLGQILPESNSNERGWKQTCAILFWKKSCIKRGWHCFCLIFSISFCIFVSISPYVISGFSLIVFMKRQVIAPCIPLLLKACISWSQSYWSLSIFVKLHDKIEKNTRLFTVVSTAI